MDLNDIRQTSSPISSVPTYSAPQTPNHSRRRVAVTVIILLALIVLGFLFMRGGFRPVAYDDAGNPVYKASEGKLIKGFPKDLLLEQDAVILESSRIDYEKNGVSLPSAKYVSQKSYIENIEGYRALLASQGWTMQKDASFSDMPLTNMYATRGDTESVNIVFIPSNEGITINVAYSSDSLSN